MKTAQDLVEALNSLELVEVKIKLNDLMIGINNVINDAVDSYDHIRGGGMSSIRKMSAYEEKIERLKSALECLETLEEHFDNIPTIQSELEKAAFCLTE